jgi:ABC transporter substrate binding protein
VRSSARHLALAVVLTAVCLAAPELTAAQQSKPPRVGIVWIGARPVVAYIHDHFVQGMRELGWIDGQNVVIEARFANDKVERPPSILGELIAARVDVLYVFPGVLLAYGTANAVVFRRVAAFVDRILKGARPGDLPVDHVEKVDFHVSLRTAKALGLTIPQPVLYRADRVIE